MRINSISSANMHYANQTAQTSLGKKNISFGLRTESSLREKQEREEAKAAIGCLLVIAAAIALTVKACNWKMKQLKKLEQPKEEAFENAVQEHPDDLKAIFEAGYETGHRDGYAACKKETGDAYETGKMIGYQEGYEKAKADGKSTFTEAAETYTTYKIIDGIFN